MSTSEAKHYGDKAGRLVLSRGAIVTIVNSNRNYGKTWAFKKRAVRRYFRRGRKTMWLRVFKEEAKEASASFFSSADLRAFCGIEPWDKDKKTGNMRREGNRIYLRKGGKWDWAILIGSLAEAGKFRGCDDVALDTIVLDEYAKTPSQLARYAGNFVTDFFDIFFSAKREHEVRAILLGNKEAYANHFLEFFGISAPKPSWTGVKTYRNGTLVLQQINNEPRETDYEKRVDALMKGTSYGNYIHGSVKGSHAIKTRKPPVGATLYAQVLFERVPFRIYTSGGAFYVRPGVNAEKAVYATGTASVYKNQMRLSNRSKSLFKAFAFGVERGAVYFENPAIAEVVAPFLAYLGIK